MSFHKQFLTPSWHLCFLLVPRVLFAKGGGKHTKDLEYSLYILIMFFLFGKVFSALSYYDGQFQDQGYQLWLYTYPMGQLTK